MAPPTYASQEAEGRRKATPLAPEKVKALQLMYTKYIKDRAWPSFLPLPETDSSSTNERRRGRPRKTPQE